MCGCFIPGCMNYAIEMRSNIAAFVESEQDGEKAVLMLDERAVLDYRAYEPHRIQVKVGACNDHLHKLEYLHRTTKKDGHITLKRVHDAYEYEVTSMIDPEMADFMDKLFGIDNYYVDKQDGEWWIFANDGEGLIGGPSMSAMLHLAYAKRDELF